MDTLAYLIKKFAVRGRDKQDPCVLPKFSRDGLAALFAELGFMRGAEIGVHLGAYSKVLCEANPKLELDSVDVWDLEDVYRHAQATLAPYNCHLLRMGSLEAAKLCPDGSLDFVYIDANHYYDPVKLDIGLWVPKVRTGGIVAGHDYHHLKDWRCQVIRAVDEYTAANKIRPYFIAAADRECSWFWVQA